MGYNKGMFSQVQPMSDFEIKIQAPEEESKSKNLRLTHLKQLEKTEESVRISIQGSKTWRSKIFGPVS